MLPHCAISPPRLEFQVIYDRLGVTIIERGESFYQPIMPAVVKDLEDKGRMAVLGCKVCILCCTKHRFQFRTRCFRDVYINAI